MVGLEEQFNAVDGCHSLAELRRVVQTYIEDCGFAAFVIADLTDPWNENPPYMSTYEKKWLDTYIRENFLPVDPTPALAKRTNFPFNWGNLKLPRATGHAKSAAARVMDTVREFGVLEGLTIPVHRRDALGKPQFCVCGLHWKGSIPAFFDSLKSHKMELYMLLLYATDKFLALHMGEHNSPRRDPSADSVSTLNLSERELEVLKWAALGKTADETADILKCSRRTVEAHVVNAIRKLGATTKTQATVQAIHRGLIAL